MTAVPTLSTRTVLTIPVHTLTAPSAADSLAAYGEWLCQRIPQQHGIHVVTCNAEMVMLAQRDPAFAEIIRTADLVPPDGAGIVWALKWQGVSVYRSPGIELAEWLLAAAAFRGYGVALIGGQPDVSATAAHYWQSTHPTLNLWTHHGYFDADQEQVILTQLAARSPQIIMVGLGSPRQEFWIRQHRSVSPSSIWIGVGGSFDIWGGVKERAPYVWRAYHLEWLYRLYQEPWRWRRMLALPHFAWKAALEVLGGHS